jgi:hypothetical protein
VYLGLAPWLGLVGLQTVLFAVGGIAIGAAWRGVDTLNLHTVSGRLLGGFFVAAAWVAREAIAAEPSTLRDVEREFLASGRPVILPPCNVAAELVDDRHAVFLRTGDSEEIAARCAELLSDPARRARLGTEARQVARRLFDLATQTSLLAAACRERLASPPRVNWNALPAPGLDERSLFADAAPSAELTAALVWAGHVPAAPTSWWRRLWSR